MTSYLTLNQFENYKSQLEMTYKYTYDWYSQVKDYGVEKLESVEG